MVMVDGVVDGRDRRRNIRRAAAVGVVLIASAGAAVNARPIAIGSIHTYQRLLSPVATRIGLRCRFTPTCSRYAEIVIARDGVVRGGARALARIARCGPWTPQGTRDPP
jgi:putative membrane protein insertion efficiency factor